MDDKRPSFLVFTEIVVSLGLGLGLLGFTGLFIPHILLIMALPILWIMWIGCALRSGIHKHAFGLIRIWIAIDLAVLIALSIPSLFTGDLNAAQGDEGVLLWMYFPVILPTGFLVALLPDENVLSIIDKALRGPVLSAFGIWLQLSFTAVLRSVGIYYAGRLLSVYKLRTRRNV